MMKATTVGYWQTQKYTSGLKKEWAKSACSYLAQVLVGFDHLKECDSVGLVFEN